MKKIFLFILPVIILAGCSTEGDIKIINRTNHYLYFTIEGANYVLEGSENIDPTYTVNIDTGSQFLFWGDDKTKVDMFMEGETFMMQDSNPDGTPSGYYYTETTLTVKSNKTLKIYCDPTHAGVKLINNSLVDVVELGYYTDDNDSLISIIDYPVVPGDSAWSRLKASTAPDSIIYSFIIEYETGDIDSSYFDIDNLVIDEQLRIELQ
ncbi:MAG: membrane lipoprotein lipid attachment site-containing protein [Candidatus Cloacimonetes bacterium]|nr:membrane lipoprotein lipid attachment site-containing protein [Candidatus Cloacimonadota bacterium]